MSTQSDWLLQPRPSLLQHPERTRDRTEHQPRASSGRTTVITPTEARPSSPTPELPTFDWDDTAEMVRDRAVLAGRSSRFGYRLFDIVSSLAALVVALPIMLVVAAVVRLTTHGPAFFVHQRVGRSGQMFPCLKFRSMWPDAQERLDDILAVNAELRSEWELTQKLRNDPRVTPVGRVLRKSNLDELPQILNVLVGQMSIVGPRPITPAETERYGDGIATVLSVKPGITGLWQVSGRSDLSYDQRVELDIAYVVQRSFLRDLVICLKTAGAMIHPSTDGAY